MIKTYNAGDGTVATVIWLDDNHQPVEPDQATSARITFSDGESAVFMVVRPELRVAARKRPAEGPLHKLADRYQSKFSVALRYAFAQGRKQLKSNPLNKVDAAVDQVKAALHSTLPKVVRETTAAGGKLTASLLRTPSLRTAKRSDKTRIDFAFDAADPAAIDWADRHAAELVAQISETTREDINNAIAAALEGDGIDSAIEEILAAVGDQDRAELIAHHEVMTAVHEGQREAWSQAVDAGLLTGTEERVWIVTGDQKVCPICEGLENKRAPLGEPYESDGEEYDGPPAHVSCRCTEGLA